MNLRWKIRKDSIIHSRKRKETTKAILTSIVSIISALIVALLVATALGYDPFVILQKLFSIGFEDPSYLFYKFGVYALAGFAFYFAWKCGIINIGISGQMLAAGTVVVILTNVMEDNLGTLPSWLGYGVGQLFIIVIAISVASSIALFVGTLQNYLKINAVVSSILLNWIIYFLSFFVLATYFVDTEQFANSSAIPNVFLLYDTHGNSGAVIPVILICLVIAVVMFVIFKYTVFGHKIKCVGLSSEASRFAGYNIKKLNLSAFAISGGISGILACVCYSSSIPAAIPLSIVYDSVPTEGFEGIMISLVGGNNPFGILLVSLLFGLFESSMAGLPTDPSFNDVIVGIVMLGSSLSVVVIKWKPYIRLNSFKYDINYFATRTAFDNSIDSLLSKYDSIYNNIKHDYKHSKKECIVEINELLKTYRQKYQENHHWYIETYNNIKDNHNKKIKYITDYYYEKYANNYDEYQKNNYDYDQFNLNIISLINNYQSQKLSITQSTKRLIKQLNTDYYLIKSNTSEKYYLERFKLMKEWRAERVYLKQVEINKLDEFNLKYDVEKAQVIDTYEYNKIKNLIYKTILTSDIIDQKSAKISTYYDNNLTKYVNKLKLRNKANYEQERTHAINRSTKWKNAKIDKMKKHQNKILNDPELFNKMVFKIKGLISTNLSDDSYKIELENLVDEAINLQKGGGN